MESKPRSPNDFIISLRELWVFSKGAEDISAGPVWCYPRDQSQLLDIGHRRESPSVTTTLFTLYLRILLYNKFDVAKPSDHITTIKLIPPSYSGGPRSRPAKSVSRITNNKLSQLWEKLCFLRIFFQYCCLSQCFCFPLKLLFLSLSWPDQSLLIFTTPGSMALLTTVTTHHLQT